MTENKKIIGKMNIDLIKGEFTPKFYLIDAGGRMIKKYRVHDLAKFHYSEIGEYIDENHTDRPLRNDVVVNLLNQLNDENEQLKQRLQQQEMEYATEHHHLAEENEKLKKEINKIKNILLDKEKDLECDYTNWRCNVYEIVDEDDEVYCIVDTKYTDKIIKVLKENEQLKHTVHKYSLQIITQDNKIIELEKENKQLIKMLDNVANYMQKEHKEIPVNQFVDWWNNIATMGLKE